MNDGSEAVTGRRARPDSLVQTAAQSVAFSVGVLLGLGLFWRPVVAGAYSPTPPKDVVIAYTHALATNDMATARSHAFGSDSALAASKYWFDKSRGMFRFKLLRRKAFGGKLYGHDGDDYDTVIADGDVTRDGNTVKVETGDMDIPVFYLTGAGGGGEWKIDLSRVREPTPAEIAQIKPWLEKYAEMSEKLEKGFYKSADELDKEERAFKDAQEEAAQTLRTPPLSEEAKAIRLGSANPSQSPGSRSKTSLGMERYLRSRYLGGGTEAQLIAVSDAMAAIFDAAPLSESSKASYFHDKDGAVEFDLARLGVNASTGDRSWEASRKVVAEMTDCIPPRMVFDDMWEYPGPRHIDQPLATDPAAVVPPHFEKDQLASEHLETLEKAIYKLAVSSADNRRSSSGYWDEVQEFAANYVVACRYRGTDPGSRSRPYFFWHEKVPEGVVAALSKLPADHPIRQIGPPIVSAPPNLAAAEALNEGVAQAKARWAEIKHETGDIPGLGAIETRNDRERRWLKGIVDVFAAARAADVANLDDSKRAVAASGGTKMLCPRCGGSKNINGHYHDSGPNPYKEGTLPNSLHDLHRDTTTIETCPVCRGTGVVDAQ